MLAKHGSSFLGNENAISNIWMPGGLLQILGSCEVEMKRRIGERLSKAPVLCWTLYFNQSWKASGLEPSDRWFSPENVFKWNRKRCLSVWSELIYSNRNLQLLSDWKPGLVLPSDGWIESGSLIPSPEMSFKSTDTSDKQRDASVPWLISLSPSPPAPTSFIHYKILSIHYSPLTLRFSDFLFLN